MGFLGFVFIGNVMYRVYESRDHGWLSIHDGLVTMGRCSCSRVWEVVVIARREREREEEEEVIGVLINSTTRRISVEAAVGALIGRWFQARRREIGARVGAVDNGCVLSMPFIRP
jgi:hypothetical protein